MQADSPIEKKADDIFDRAPFAERIAQIVASRQDPSSLVIGLYGPWGDGKTSTIGMIKETLASDDAVITMDYNPWFYGSATEHLARTFFASIKDKLEQTGLFTRENIGSAMSILGSSVPYIGNGLDKAGQAIATTEALSEARDNLGSVLRRHGKKIVIFVDDIDRLDREDIQTLFKLVRLSGGFDHTTYVLAFDDGIVAEALGQAYGAGDPAAGRRFLEKIVQVPLHLPPVRSEKLRDLLFAACDRVLASNNIELDENQGSILGTALATGFVHALQTPRQIKLFENAIGFAVPLLKGEVCVIDQIQIEALRIFYPSIYEEIRRNPESVLQARERRDADPPTPVKVAVSAILGGADEKEAISELLSGLFPRFGTMGYGSDWDRSWAEKKKICSRDYFTRYFAYSVPAGDISDLAIDELIAQAEAGEAEEVTRSIADAYDRGAAELLIRKLRSRERTLALTAAPALIDAIAHQASRIPVSRDILMSDFLLTQASAFIAEVAARAEPDVQDAWLRKAISETDSYFFAAHVLATGLPKSKSPEDGTTIPTERLNILGNALFERLKSVPLTDFFETVGDRVARVIYAIKGTSSPAVVEELRQFLATIVAAESANAVKFLKAFAGRSQGSDGVTSVSDFTRDTYVAVAGLLDEKQVYGQLLAEFGEGIGKSWKDADEETGEVDRRVANQFAFLHNLPIPSGDSKEGSTGS